MDKQFEAIEELYGEDTEIEDANWSHWGLPVFTIDGRRDFAVALDEEQAKEATKEYIRESVWAFNASFIIEHCGLPYELEECLREFAGSKCEGANDAILALIDKCGNLDRFVEEAIAADGIGHFLDQWDGNEQTATNGCLLFQL